MKYANEQALNTAIKAGERHGAYLLYGTENYLIESWAKKLAAPAGASPFNLQRFDGQKPDIDALWDATEALPLMAEDKCVLLDGIDAGKLGAGDLEKLDNLLADLPESTLLLITAKHPGFDGRSGNAKKLIALLDKYGAAVNLGARSESALVRFLVSAAKKHGCELAPDTARHLIHSVGEDMNTLRSELHKVCAYAGAGAVSAAHIDAVVVPKIEARMFELQKHILAGDATRSLELVDTLFYQREQPIAIVAVLASSFADLYRARIAREHGVSQPQFAEWFGYKEYRARYALRDARRLSLRSLRDMMDCLLSCDLRLKSTGAQDRVLVEQTVLRLLLLAGEHRR